MWDLLGPGLEPGSPALAGGFFPGGAVVKKVPITFFRVRCLSCLGGFSQVRKRREEYGGQNGRDMERLTAKRVKQPKNCV